MPPTDAMAASHPNEAMAILLPSSEEGVAYLDLLDDATGPTANVTANVTATVCRDHPSFYQPSSPSTYHASAPLKGVCVCVGGGGS